MPASASTPPSLSQSHLPRMLRRPRVRQVILLLWHCAGILLSLGLAYQFRFDFHIPDKYWGIFSVSTPIALISYLAFYLYFGLFSGLWAYFGINDLVRTVKAIFWGTVAFTTSIFLLFGMNFTDKPRSIFPMTFALLLVWEAGGRGISRYWILRSNLLQRSATGTSTLLLAPIHDADQILRNPSILHGDAGNIIAILTDETDKIGMTLQGLPILGNIQTAASNAKLLKAHQLLVLPPYSSPDILNAILDDCAKAHIQCAIRTLPSMDDVTSGQIQTIRKVEIEDLLPREPNTFDRTPVAQQISGKSILITGAGGSIGSELCRQTASLSPKNLILFENSEFALYTIQQELAAKYPGLALHAVAADIRNKEDCDEALTRFGTVDVIFHAAAYKHVHLMEKNIPAAFHNNVLGTACLADSAERHGVADFILISSDKAVRPTSIMGATKRLAERLLMERPIQSTSFRAVRFGNVMGSSGSVIPRFKQQIAARGPVTVTTPDTCRYFMTIPEAVELVLMAGAVGTNRDIMVLEMGEPVKILNLAERLIQLSGFIPYKDIPIVFTDLRPGEKEYEELITDGENVVRTEHQKIWVLKRNSSPHAPPVDLDTIRQLVSTRSSEKLRSLLGVYIPESTTFHPPAVAS